MHLFYSGVKHAFFTVPVIPILLILECEATPVAVFPWIIKITHIAPAYAAVITWQYWQKLGKVTAGPTWKPTPLVDAIQDKLIIPNIFS